MVVVFGVVPAILAAVNLSGLAEAAIGLGQLPIFVLLFVGGLTILYRYAPDRARPVLAWQQPGGLGRSGAVDPVRPGLQLLLGQHRGHARLLRVAGHGGRP